MMNNTVCLRPPPGWWCSRQAPHEGPCAARPEVYIREETRTRTQAEWLKAAQELSMRATGLDARTAYDCVKDGGWEGTPFSSKLSQLMFLAGEDVHCSVPDNYVPSPEAVRVFREAPALDPDLSLGGPKEVQSGEAWLQEQEALRNKSNSRD